MPPFVGVAGLLVAAAAIDVWDRRDNESKDDYSEPHNEYMDALTRSKISGAWRYSDAQSGRKRVEAAIEAALEGLDADQRAQLDERLRSELVPDEDQSIELELAIDYVGIQLPGAPVIAAAPLGQRVRWRGHPKAPQLWHSLDGRVLNQHVQFDDGTQIYRRFTVADGKLAVGVEMRSSAFAEPLRYTLHYARVGEADLS